MTPKLVPFRQIIFAVLRLRWRLGLDSHRKGSWGCFGGRISKMASSEKDNRSVQQEVKLNENYIPGAELPKPAELCTSAILKRWLSCRGAKVSGKRKDLIKRLVCDHTRTCLRCLGDRTLNFIYCIFNF